MQRVGFTFKIRPEVKADYKKAHDEIWPDLVDAMKEHGMSNYSIYFKKDGTLFAYLEVDGDFKEVMAEFSKLSVNERWQNYMDKYFVKEDKSILGPEIEMLEEVFHMD